MPLYEYECEKCGDIFEVMQKFSDEPLTTHEKCGGPVHKRLSAPALQFKGSGWYITDYAKSSGSSSGTGNGGGGEKSDSAAKPSSESSSASESKPAASGSETKKPSSSSDTK